MPSDLSKVIMVRYGVRTKGKNIGLWSKRWFLVPALLSLGVTLSKLKPFLFLHLVSSASVLLNFLGLLLE